MLAGKREILACCSTCLILMGGETSKVLDPEEDTIDAYLDRDGGYLVNRHRRTATVTTIDIGLSQEKEDYNVRVNMDGWMDRWMDK